MPPTKVSQRGTEIAMSRSVVRFSPQGVLIGFESFFVSAQSVEGNAKIVESHEHVWLETNSLTVAPYSLLRPPLPAQKHTQGVMSLGEMRHHADEFLISLDRLIAKA